MTTRRAAAVATVAAVAVVIAALVLPIADRGWLGGFRLFLYPDQLSYAAIASNVAGGDLGLVEPFTGTGTLFYASGWYQLIGIIALVSGLPVHLSWTLLGLLIVSAAVAVAGWTAYRVSGRAYGPLLPAAGLLTGTLATVLTGSWLIRLDSHAVLWGPTSTLFTLNGEVAGLCIIAIAINLVHLASMGTRGRSGLVVVAGFAIGLTAMVHTYAFIAGTLLSVTLAAALGLIRSASPRRMLLTIALVAAVLLAGPWLAGVIGPLPVFGLMLLAFLPAVMPVIAGSPALAAWTLLAYGAAAAPQVVRIAIGYLTDDPFLSYRALSSASLGVPVIGGTVAALVFVLAAALCVVVLTGSGQSMQQAVVAAVVVSGVLLSQNDRWGFNQEPYRFWVAFTVVGALVLSPVLAWSLAALRRSPRRRVAGLLALALAATWIISLADVVGSSLYARDQGVLATDDARARALRSAVDGAEGLVLPSRCLPPSWVANLTQADVAFYNRGLAWPANEEGLRPFLDPDARAGDDARLRQSAGIAYVLTASDCADDWSVSPRDGAPVVEIAFPSGGTEETFTLWQLVHRPS